MDMARGWIVLLGLLAMTATAQAATVEVKVGRDDPMDPNVAYLRYYPETAVVWAGDTVRWKADSVVPHTTTGPGFDSTPILRLDDPAIQAWFAPGGFLMPGKSFNVTFDKPGEFRYFCKIHPAMTGVVRVLNDTAAAQGQPGIGLPGTGTGAPSNQSMPEWEYVAAGWGSGDTSYDAFGPAVLTVHAGTTVVWTNLHTAEPHTVTSSTQSMPYDSSPNIGPPPPWFEGPEGMLTTAGQHKEFSHTFAQPGHFVYVCKIHPGMVGTVVVLEKPAAPTNGSAQRPPNQSAGSTVPGLEAPLLGLGVLAAALLARRRA